MVMFDFLPFVSDSLEFVSPCVPYLLCMMFPCLLTYSLSLFVYLLTVQLADSNANLRHLQQAGGCKPWVKYRKKGEYTTSNTEKRKTHKPYADQLIA